MSAFQIPGTGTTIEYDVLPNGELGRLTLGGETYLHRLGEAYVFAGDWYQFKEKRLGRTLIRQVQAGEDQWLETYAWDASGLVQIVDGTWIERNEEGYISACHSHNEHWRYQYKDHQLVAIDGPHGHRSFQFANDQRPLNCQGGDESIDFDYDSHGSRKDTPATPPGWNLDEWGRLWTISDGSGRITTTYLWWGFACLARIDGPPGEPIAAVFSLDPSGTPVRMTTPHQQQRFTRDAFGENLLAVAGLPGLFGGAQDGRFVHYRSRVMDPMVASFTAADPWHGGKNDPRRQDGFGGPLPVELPPAGPYCVCQHDPLSRMDPTGEISAGVGSFFTTLSSLTWGFQNNLTGITMLGFWNIMLSLLSFNGKTIKRIGDVEAMRSSYTGAWGFRCHPSGLELLGINRHRAWTVQHIIWARGDKFEELDKARVFIPDKTFKPTLNGSLLWVQPKHGKKKTDPGIGFVLAGNLRGGAPMNQTNGFADGWTRSGSIGEKVFPGATTPWFPEGGLHFPYQHLVPSPVVGTIAEVLPSGEIYQGQMQSRLTIGTQELSATPAKGDLVLAIRDKKVGFYTIRGNFSEGEATILVTETVPTVMEHFSADIFKVELDLKKEILPQGSSRKRLDARKPPANHHYRIDQYLKLEGGIPDKIIAGAKVTGLEAKVTLDENPPAISGKPPYRIYQANSFIIQGSGQVTAKTEIKFDAKDPQPKADQIIVLMASNHRGIYQVSAGGDSETFVLDRDIIPELVTAKTVQWYIAHRETLLGEWNGTGGSKDIVYTPKESGHAPASMPILIKNKEKQVLGVRNIRAQLADEVLLSVDLPGGLNPHAVTLLKKGDRLESDAHIEDRTVLAVDETKARRTQLAKSSVLQLLRINAPTITSGTSAAVSGGRTVILNQTWTGNALDITTFTHSQFPVSFAATHAPMPGQMVVLRENSTNNIELASAQSLKANITLANAPKFHAGFSPPATGWQLIPLIENGLYFQGERKNNDEVLLAPRAYRMSAINTFDTTPPGIGADDVWLPRFREDQIVRAIWELAGTTTSGLYRISQQDGSYLKLEGHPNIPVGTNHLAICSMEARSPDNGHFAAAIKGSSISATQYEFSVCHPNAIAIGAYALTVGNRAWGVEVTQLNQLLIEFRKVPGLKGKNTDIIIPTRDDEPLFSGHHQVVEDEWFFARSHLLPSPNRVLVQAYTDPKGAALVSGQLTPGNVGIPNDKSDKFELNRRQSLETHELQHTIQFLSQGPLVFAMIPLFLFDVMALGTGEGLETAEYSAFVDGTLSNTQTKLLIPDPGNIDFSEGRQVQLVQNANATIVVLGSKDANGFQVSGATTLSDGQVAVRLQRKSATKKLALAHSIMEIFTTGGLQSALIGPLVNLIPWSIAQIVHACQGDPAGRFTQPNMFPATVPDADNPFIIQVPAKDGDPHGLAIHDRVETLVNSTRDNYTVTAVNGEMVNLDGAASFSGANRELQVGKIGENHPMKQVVDRVADTFGTRDLRWFFDPLGQLFYKVDPNDRDTLDWTLAFLRPFYSTTSWSGLGILGGFWLDIVYTTAFGQDYYSFMEQGASEMSGDLYSPVGRLRGDLEYVGDLGRYFYYHDSRNGFAAQLICQRMSDNQIRIDDPGPGNEYRIGSVGYRIGDEVSIRWSGGKQFFEITTIEKTVTPTANITLTLKTIPGIDSIGGIPAGKPLYRIMSAHFMHFNDSQLIPRANGDTAGIHAHDFLRVIPLRTPPGNPPGREPNLAAASPSPSSQALPHQLYEKSFNSPLNPQATNPISYRPSTLGSIPASPALQRSRGMYVAFSQPSNNPHRITVTNDFSVKPQAGREAHKVCGTTRQTLFFDQQIKDVKVFQQKAEITASIDLVFCQKARLRVEPEKKRVYQLTVADTKHDTIARNQGSMSLLAQTTTGNTSVEIARSFDGKSPPTHLNLPFVVPIRQVKVKVGDTLELREEAKPGAPVISRDAKPGDTFYLLVPAKLTKPDLKTVETRAYLKAPPAGHLDPDSGMKPIAKKDLDEGVAEYLGAGQAVQVRFKQDDPPEEPLNFKWDIQVEAGQTHAPKKLTAVLKSNIKLAPHFRLESHPTAGDFQTLENAGNTITLQPEPNTIAIDDDVIITSSDKAITNPQTRFEINVKDNGKTLELKTIDKTVAGFYQILVTNKADDGQKARRTIEII